MDVRSVIFQTVDLEMVYNRKGIKMENVSVEQAVELILEQTKVLEEVEYVSLLESQGRILAEDMMSEFDNPPFDRSPIDGYACKAEDIAGASRENPVILKVLEEIDAGQYSEVEVKNGEAVRIMTGAAIPAGCNCCLRQESTDYGEDHVAVYEGVAPWMNYCYKGEDFKKDTKMVEKGTKLGYVELAILASMGCAEVPVYRMPRIALLTTGDEVTTPGKELLPGKIYNSNQTMLAARMHEFGIRPVIIETVKDEPDVMAERLKEIAPQIDIVITTGGVSVGKKDIMHGALPMIGAERIFWRVMLKPGTPTIFSVYEGVPIVSLSGNPFGAMANFELLVRPMLAKMMKDSSIAPVRMQSEMADPFPKASRGRRFIRGIWKEGSVHMPSGLHSSGVLSSLQGCNCMVDIKPGTDKLTPGDKVEIVLI